MRHRSSPRPSFYRSRFAPSIKRGYLSSVADDEADDEADDRNATQARRDFTGTSLCFIPFIHYYTVASDSCLTRSSSSNNKTMSKGGSNGKKKSGNSRSNNSHSVLVSHPPVSLLQTPNLPRAVRPLFCSSMLRIRMRPR